MKLPNFSLSCAALIALACPVVVFAALLHSPQAGRTESDESSRLTQEGLLAVEQGHFATAHELFAHALDLSPNSSVANNALGHLLTTEHLYPEAMDRFETILNVDLRNVTARAGELNAATQLALASRNAGRPEAALLCLQHASEHLPDDAVLLLDLGIQAEQVRKLPVAQKALEASLALRPDDATTLYALSRVELDQENFPDSERHLRTYLAKSPDDASAHYGLGHLLEMQQRIEAAKVEFQRSIELQPLQTESYYQLGQIALDQGKLNVASPLFEKTLARDPHHGGALSGLGIIAYRGKDLPSARRLLSAAVQSSPEYQPAHYYLGLTLGRLGEKQEADRELKQAVSLAQQQSRHGAPRIETNSALPQP